MTGTKAGHFLVVPLAAWGHVRPLLHLSINILIAHPSLHLTLLLANSVSPRVEKELSSASLSFIHNPHHSSGKALIDRLQIIHVASEKWKEEHPIFDVSLMVEEAMEYAKILPTALTALDKGEGFEGQANKFGALKPDFIIYDAFQAFVPDAVRAVAKALNQKVTTMITFGPSNAAACFHHFASAAAGGFIDGMLVSIDRDIKAGVSEDEAWSKHIFTTEGKVKTIPGLVTMYDYEFFPQIGAVPLPPQLGQQVAGMLNSVRDKDTVAIVAPTVLELETETHKALEKELGKPFLQTGLQFPESTWQGVALQRDINDPEQKRVLAFLDDQLKKNGEKSVAYVSFGSAWFPAGRPELAKWLVESLTESGVPFVFAYATEMFPVSPDLVEYVKSNPNACAVQFAPQWHILEHPATRFFVSHCGSNSTAESMVAGVPMVSHPFGADQGEFTAMLEKLGVTIDLKQVKTFRNKEWKKLYNGGEVIGTEQAIKDEQKHVWKEMMGAKGDELRRNMEKVRATVAMSRESGASKKAMESFSQYC